MTSKTLIIILIIITLSLSAALINDYSKPEAKKIQKLKTDALTFLSVNGDKIVNKSGEEVMLRGFHFGNAFYPVSKQWYFAPDKDGRQLDIYNTDLSKYIFSDYDIEQFKNFGANVARVQFRLWHIEKEPYAYSEESLRNLDRTIAKFGENGIYVILDLHAAGQNPFPHNSEYGNILWDDTELQNRVVSLWGVIADRYKDNPYVAGYDLINEPTAPSKEVLRNLHQNIIDKIREFDQKHIVITEVNLYEKESILVGGSYSDDNLAVSMHFYKPASFANQGKRGLPIGQKYPGMYNSYWDKNKIDQDFSKFLNFDELEGRPMFVGEFGATRVGGDDALQWTKDVMDVMNKKGIHYTIQDYKEFNMAYFYLDDASSKKIINLQRQLMNGSVSYENLHENQKKIFLTENLETWRGLKQILEKGFKKK